MKALVYRRQIALYASVRASEPWPSKVAVCDMLTRRVCGYYLKF